MVPSLADYLESPNKQDFKASTFAKQRTGLFKEIRSLQMNGQYSFRNTNIGINAIANRKGKFIKRDRAYINYAVHIPLNKKQQIAGGVSVGLVNYSIANNTGGPSGSDTKADGSIALAYYDKRNTINITINQITRPKLSPFYEETYLPRFFQALILRNYKTRDKKWSGYGYGRLDVYSEYYTQLSAGTKTIFKEKIMAGASFNTDGDFFTSVGFEYNWHRKSVVEAYIGYQIQTGVFEFRYNTSSVQAGLIFYSKK